MNQINDSVGAKDKMEITASAHMAFHDSIQAPSIIFDVVCHGPDEVDRPLYLNLKEKEDMAYRAGDTEKAISYADQAHALVKEQWREKAHNTVMTAGKTDIIDKYLKGSAYTAAWYMILAGSGAISAADTLASHAGWAEITAYSGNRPAITWGTSSAGSNTATAVVITMNAGYTVAGAGCCTVNTGTSGILYDAADFGTARSGGSGDTLTITPTLSVA